MERPVNLDDEDDGDKGKEQEGQGGKEDGEEDEEEEEDGEEDGDTQKEDGKEKGYDDSMTGAKVTGGVTVACKRKGRGEEGPIKGPKIPKMKHIRDVTRKTRTIKSNNSRKKQEKTLKILSGGARLICSNEVQEWPGPLPTEMDADSKEWYFTEAKITLDINDTPQKIEETQEWRVADATGNWHAYKPALHVSISLVSSTFSIERLYSTSK